MGRMVRKLGGLVKAFGSARRGNVAMMTGVALPVLLMGTAGAIDLHNMVRVKSELQDALDAATLAAARSPYTDQSSISRVGMNSLKANMPGYFAEDSGDSATFTVTGRSKVNATATVNVKTIVANIFLPPYGKLFDDSMPMNATSEVLRASRNVEVAMALDVTGSMSASMGDLRTAAKDLVSIVIQGDQEVFTTRVALVPYAAGVNVGPMANDMRGALVGRQTITSMDWAGNNISISRIRSGLFETSTHGLSVGDYVYISGLGGSAIGLNGRTLKVTAADGSGFRVDGFTNNGSLDNGYQVRKCLYDGCAVGVTVSGHIVQQGDYVSVSNVSGMSSMSRSNMKVLTVNGNTFTVDRHGSQAGGYNGTGILTCHGDGCATRRFDNRSGTRTELPNTNCVSERPRNGSQPSDRYPFHDSWLGRVVIGSDNTCPSAVYVPLTNDKPLLDRAITAYQSGGSTAGQIGIEMAWYSVSPNFSVVRPDGTHAIPAASRAYAFNTSETIKAVVLMTDGEFNTPYCKGVIARDAGSGSGSDSNKIGCNATNGNGFAQSIAICNAMKAQGIVVYTVGFALGTGRGGAGIDTAYEVMENCATSREHFFPAASGTDLKEAFKAIGRDITRLRIAR